jgi:transcriptional regulator GlxA family with amidase domain
MSPDIKIQKNVRWVDKGPIVTAAGISAGIDMGLHLVSRLADEDLAIRTAKQMEFDWLKTHSQSRVWARTCSAAQFNRSSPAIRCGDYKRSITNR